jgi:hypothetical protein
MIEAQTLAEGAITEIRDAPDHNALERIRRDFVGEDSGRLRALLATAHPEHHHHIHGAIGRVEAAVSARAAHLGKPVP